MAVGGPDISTMVGGEEAAAILFLVLEADSPVLTQYLEKRDRLLTMEADVGCDPMDWSPEVLLPRLETEESSHPGTEGSMGDDDPCLEKSDFFTYRDLSFIMKKSKSSFSVVAAAIGIGEVAGFILLSLLWS